MAGYCRSGDVCARKVKDGTRFCAHHGAELARVRQLLGYDDAAAGFHRTMAQAPRKKAPPATHRGPHGRMTLPFRGMVDSAQFVAYLERKSTFAPLPPTILKALWRARVNSRVMPATIERVLVEFGEDYLLTEMVGATAMGW